MTSRLRVSLVFALAVGALAPAPVFATPLPSTTVLEAVPASPGASEPVCIHATTTVTDTGVSVNGGNVMLYETTSGSEVYVGFVQFSFGMEATGQYCFTSGLAMGSHSYKGYYTSLNADAYGPSDDTLGIDVGQATPTFVLWTSPNNTVEAHNSFTITTGIYDYGIDEQGTLSVYRTGQSAPLCSQLLTSTDSYECTVPAPPIGTYQLTAVYSGTTSVAAATSDPYALTVTADTVHASSVGVSLTTFYPYKDGYKDTVTIKGVRNEPITATIRIYSPTGSLLKTVTTAQNTGTYSTSWSGRNSAGTIYAEGKYKVVQTLKDAAGTTKAYTSYVTLSKKRLVTYTKSLTKLGSSITAKGKSGTGTYSFNTTSGTAVLKAGSSGWAGAGWEFTLPTATTYSSLKFRVYAKASLSIPYLSQIGMQSFVECPYVSGTSWDTSCFGRWADIGNAGTVTAWFSTSGSTSTYRSGTHVRGLVSVLQSNVTVYKAQVVITYAVLQY